MHLHSSEMMKLVGRNCSYPGNSKNDVADIRLLLPCLWQDGRLTTHMANDSARLTAKKPILKETSQVDVWCLLKSLVFHSESLRAKRSEFHEYNKCLLCECFKSITCPESMDS